MNSVRKSVKAMLRPYWHRLRGIQIDPFSDASIWPLLFLGEGKESMVVAEIGVFKARSSVAMLTRWNVSHFYAVDLWRPYDEYVTTEVSITTEALQKP